MEAVSGVPSVAWYTWYKAVRASLLSRNNVEKSSEPTNARETGERERGHCERESESYVEVILTTASNVLRVYNARVCFARIAAAVASSWRTW